MQQIRVEQEGEYEQERELKEFADELEESGVRYTAFSSHSVKNRHITYLRIFTIQAVAAAFLLIAAVIAHIVGLVDFEVYRHAIFK